VHRGRPLVASTTKNAWFCDRHQPKLRLYPTLKSRKPGHVQNVDLYHYLHPHPPIQGHAWQSWAWLFLHLPTEEWAHAMLSAQPPAALFIIARAQVTRSALPPAYAFPPNTHTGSVLSARPCDPQHPPPKCESIVPRTRSITALASVR